MRRAAALADDLDRFLSGQPVRARRTPYWERAVKLIRRRPTAASLLAVACLFASILLLAVVRRSCDFAEQDARGERAHRGPAAGERTGPGGSAQ